MIFPGTIYVRIQYDEASGLPDWVCSALNHKGDADKTVEFFNQVAKSRGLTCTYTLATLDEYLAYRSNKA